MPSKLVGGPCGRPPACCPLCLSHVNGGRAQAPLLVSYTPEMERVNGIAPLSRPWHGRILLLNHTRKKKVAPAGLSPATLTLRTRPLCALSYGDKNWYARPVTLRNPALI